MYVTVPAAPDLGAATALPASADVAMAEVVIVERDHVGRVVVLAGGGDVRLLALEMVGYAARKRAAISCAPVPLAMYTARRFDVSWASQSNAPPSMSGTWAPSGAVTQIM